MRANEAATKKEASKILGHQSVHNVSVGGIGLLSVAVWSDSPQNTFLDHFSHYTSIYEAVSADLLHQIELGVHSKHIWPWVVSKGDIPG